MLVDFRFKNFRSFCDEQEFSLVASNDKTLRESNAFETGITAVPYVLRSAAIYGANASGKSNVIKALQYMKNVVVRSASLPPDQKFNNQPFQLDVDYKSKPTEFDITFLIGNVRYEYGFSLMSDRIISEYLLVYKSFKPQRWFERFVDDVTGEDRYVFSSSFRGSKSVWQKATRQNSLFLSMAVQLNCEDLKPIFNWLTSGIVVFNEHAQLSPDFTVKWLEEDGRRAEICKFLTAADISIADIDIVTRKMPGKALHFDMGEGKTEVIDQKMEQKELLFHHETEKGQAVFSLNDESSGTRSFLFLTGPLFDILEKGLTLVVDELDTSLHPHLVCRIVELFHNNKINKAGAQLLFSTHDASLLDVYGLFRRDQVWFVEKDEDQASALFPLLDFSPRKNEAIGRGYLNGRYGGIPFLEDWE